MSKISQGIDVAVPDFAAARKAGSLVLNMGRAPVLVVDGESIGQSAAIERYAARRLGLYGASEIEGAKIDMLGEHLADIKKTYQDAKKKEKAGQEGAVDKWFADDLPSWLAKLEACLGATTGFAVGAKTSLADAKIYVFMKEYFDNLEGVAAAASECPKVVASAEGFAAKAEVAAYLSGRKVTPM
jgi:glutathione S-transferase